MKIASAQWKLSERLSQDRRYSLLEPIEYEELVDLAAQDITQITIRIKPGEDPGLTHARQPIFSFALPTVGDRLFNGQFGYRAQYWRDPYRGIWANAHLIRTFAQRLKESFDEAMGRDPSEIDILSALEALSAKFWIDESYVDFSKPEPDLEIQRWLEHARSGSRQAHRGLMAPDTTRFCIRGALLDRYGHELVPESKRGRHNEIYQYGFS